MATMKDIGVKEMKLSQLHYTIRTNVCVSSQITVYDKQICTRTPLAASLEIFQTALLLTLLLLP